MTKSLWRHVPRGEKSAFFAAAVAMKCSVAASQSICTSEKSPLTEFGRHYVIGRTVSSASPHQTLPLAHAGEDVRYVRLLIEPSSLTDGWTLIIRDQQLRPLQTIDSRSFVEGSGTVWTDRLPTSVVDLSLIVWKDLPGFSVKIPAADAMPLKAEHPYYSVKGAEPDWLPLYSSDFSAVPPKVRPLGDAVGMMTTFAGSSIGRVATWCCSGSIITTEPVTLFLTNFHCGGLPNWTDANFWQSDVCSNTIIDMSWDDDSISVEYACKRVVKVDPGLDAAVLAITPMTLHRSPPRPVKIRTRPVNSGETVMIIHHPQCLPKRISQGCSVIRLMPNWRSPANTTEFAHRCDSEGGSSGGPIFDADGNFVGLHHLGYENDNAGHCDRINKAVAASALLDFLKGLPISTVPTSPPR